MAFVALLDANAIWSGAVRDTLLLAAERDLYRPLWTAEILDEMGRSLKRRRPDLDPGRIDRTVRRIAEAFPEAMVQGYRDLIPAMRNHEADRHVLAAAVRGSAAAIVTWNRQHFPAEARTPYEIDVQSPDEFLCHLWSSDPDQMALVLAEQSEHLKNPPKSVRQVLETLRKSVPQFVEAVLQSGLV
jgi:hypothetical protein